MSDTEGYNGWANRETWLVALWINNDQGSQERVHETLREAVGEVVVGDEGYEQADVPLKAWEAGAIVKEMIQESIYGDGGIMADNASLASDLLGTALDNADWDEIGASFLSDIAEQS